MGSGFGIREPGKPIAGAALAQVRAAAVAQALELAGSRLVATPPRTSAVQQHATEPRPFRARARRFTPAALFLVSVSAAIFSRQMLAPTGSQHKLTHLARTL
jgi:hypothetical protein